MWLDRRNRCTPNLREPPASNGCREATWPVLCASSEVAGTASGGVLALKISEIEALAISNDGCTNRCRGPYCRCRSPLAGVVGLRTFGRGPVTRPAPAEKAGRRTCSPDRPFYGPRRWGRLGAAHQGLDCTQRNHGLGEVDEVGELDSDTSESTPQIAVRHYQAPAVSKSRRTKATSSSSPSSSRRSVVLCRRYPHSLPLMAPPSPEP